jgi:uncharacterized SAM-binding protein YcdF (DUF218 family)
MNCGNERPSMLLILKTLLRSLILPPAGPLLLSMLGALLVKRRPIIARACLILGLGSLWLLSTPVLSDALTGLAERYPALDLTSATGAEAIVILGSGGQITRAPEYGGPSAQPLLLDTLSYGAYAARKTGLPILISGAPIEAAAMSATLLRNFDLTPRWVDNKSGDTFENAHNSAELLSAGGIRRVILITRATHLWRAAHEFTAAGIDVVPAPVGILSQRGHGSIVQYVPDADALRRSSAALYELLGEPVRVLLAISHIRRQ